MEGLGGLEGGKAPHTLKQKLGFAFLMSGSKRQSALYIHTARLSLYTQFEAWRIKARAKLAPVLVQSIQHPFTQSDAHCPSTAPSLPAPPHSLRVTLRR